MIALEGNNFGQILAFHVLEDLSLMEEDLEEGDFYDTLFLDHELEIRTNNKGDLKARNSKVEPALCPLSSVAHHTCRSLTATT